MPKCRFLITGGSGMVGEALKEILIGRNVTFLSSRECDLRDEMKTVTFFRKCKPKYVIHLAARVGGIKANSDYIADFFTENIRINTNVLECSRMMGVKKAISVLSTCIYPAKVKYPLTEEQLHNGFPHESNYGYAFAKRALDVMSRAYRKQYNCNFITAISNNLFGKYDNFDLDNSHVIPAIIRKIHEAKINDKKEVIFWGDGSAKREFTYAKDFAKALLFLFEKYEGEEPVNLGNTKEYTIKTVVGLVSKMLDYKGKIIWDKTKPNGQLKKPSSNKKFLKLGWKEKDYTDFEIALKETVDWVVYNYPNLRGIKI